MNTIKFTKTHEWIIVNNDEGLVGVTDHAQTLLGDLVYVELPKVGTTVRKGQELCVVESVKAAADVYAPVSGTVTAINPAVKADPSLINTSPMDEGWLFKLTVTHPDEIKELLDKETYERDVAGEH